MAIGVNRLSNNQSGIFASPAFKALNMYQTFTPGSKAATQATPAAPGASPGDGTGLLGVDTTLQLDPQMQQQDSLGAMNRRKSSMGGY